MSESEGLSNEGLSKRFDPRFSPAFQPGYDARVHREAPPAAPLREEPRRDWPHAAPPSQAGRDVPETRDEFPAFAIPGDAEHAAETAGDGSELEEAEPAPWWRRINPWFVVLWVLGIAIILTSFQLVNVVFDAATNQGPINGSLGYLTSMLPQMVVFGLPSLICLGLATFVTPFVILAARWHRAG